MSMLQVTPEELRATADGVCRCQPICVILPKNHAVLRLTGYLGNFTPKLVSGLYTLAVRLPPVLTGFGLSVLI